MGMIDCAVPVVLVCLGAIVARVLPMLGIHLCSRTNVAHQLLQTRSILGDLKWFSLPITLRRSSLLSPGS